MAGTIIITKFNSTAITTSGVLVTLAVEDWPVLDQLSGALFAEVGAAVLPAPVWGALAAGRCAGPVV